MDNSSPLSFQESFDSVVFCRDLQFIIPSFLSAVSTFIILIFSITGKFWTRPLSAMIFAINFADFIFFIAKLSVLVHDPGSNFGCQIMQVINVFGLTCSASWAALFGHAFYKVLKNQHTSVLTSLIKYYVPISFILPVLTGTGTFFTDNILSLGDGVCVYRIYVGEFDWFVLFHIQLPMLIAVILCIAYYILSLRQLREIVIEGQVTEALTLMVYPAILILCWGPLAVMQLMAELGMKTPDSLAKTLRIVSHLMGFFNAVVYGEGVKGTMRGCFKGFRRKIKKIGSSGSYTESPAATENAKQIIRQNSSKTNVRFDSRYHSMKASRLKLEFTESFKSSALFMNESGSLL